MQVTDRVRPARVAVRLIVVLVLCAASRAAADPFLDLPNGERIYNTGVDVVAGVDQRYEMTLNPASPGSPTANLNSAFYLSANDPNSAWIGPAQADVHVPESVYRVRTLVDLTTDGLLRRHVAGRAHDLTGHGLVAGGVGGGGQPGRADRARVEATGMGPTPRRGRARRP